MKSIKNSLKKFNLYRSSYRESTQSNEENETTIIIPDIESKKHDYQEKVAKIVTHKNYDFPENAIHTRVLEEIEDLELREDDVLLLSYPATSAHLLQDIVQSMLVKDKMNKLTKADSSQTNAKISIPIARMEVSNPYGHIRWLKSLKSPRLLASHLAYDLLPRQIQTPNCKIIYLIRNPKDHIVAYYYHHRFKGVQMSLDDFIELYLNGYLLYGNYFDHVLSFWQLAQIYPDNVFFVSYEELKMITFSMAKLLAQFLNLSLDEDEIKEVLSDKHPVTTNNVNDDADSTHADETLNRKNSVKINKYHGVLGDWVNYFDPDQTKKVDNAIKLKFESQKLVVACDSSEAIKRIKKYGRIIDCERRVASKGGKSNGHLHSGGSYMVGQRNYTKPFRMKPIFTKAEATFIRKKDKVLIVEETTNLTKQSNKERYLARLSAVILWCCCCGRKKYSENYYKL